MPLTKDEARSHALEAIREEYHPPDDEPVILDGHTLARSWGWCFFWDSARHQKTGSIADALGGNAPVIVNADGSVHFTGTAHPVEYYIDEYERSLRE